MLIVKDKFENLQTASTVNKSCFRIQKLLTKVFRRIESKESENLVIQV